MTRQLRLALSLCAATLAALPAAAQDTRPGIAVLPFENGGSFGQEKEDFDGLARGIPGMLISELSRNPAARLVERSATQRIIDEQDLARNGRVDAATAARIGKMVGARYMVTGTFMDYYGRFRIDARLIDVETSEILKVVSTGQRDRKELFQMITDVADQIMQGSKLPPLPANAAQRRTVPTDALTLYSRAVLYQDRGETAKAIEYYQRAIATFPDYAEAQEGLKQLRPS
jgi:TolB-like protein